MILRHSLQYFRVQDIEHKKYFDQSFTSDNDHRLY